MPCIQPHCDAKVFLVVQRAADQAHRLTGVGAPYAQAREAVSLVEGLMQRPRRHSHRRPRPGSARGPGRRRGPRPGQRRGLRPGPGVLDWDGPGGRLDGVDRPGAPVLGPQVLGPRDGHQTQAGGGGEQVAGHGPPRQARAFLQGVPGRPGRVGGPVRAQRHRTCHGQDVALGVCAHQGQARDVGHAGQPAWLATDPVHALGQGRLNAGTSPRGVPRTPAYTPGLPRTGDARGARHGLVLATVGSCGYSQEQTSSTP
jgi:hypothetical protein